MTGTRVGRELGIGRGRGRGAGKGIVALASKDMKQSLRLPLATVPLTPVRASLPGVHNANDPPSSRCTPHTPCAQHPPTHPSTHKCCRTPPCIGVTREGEGGQVQATGKGTNTMILAASVPPIPSHVPTPTRSPIAQTRSRTNPCSEAALAPMREVEWPIPTPAAPPLTLPNSRHTPPHMHPQHHLGAALLTLAALPALSTSCRMCLGWSRRRRSSTYPRTMMTCQRYTPPAGGL